LSFTGEWKNLEPLYIEHHARASLTRVRIAMLVGLFFYLAFAVLDAMVVPNQKMIFWLDRKSVV
jgi:hypothetical protein